MAPIEQDRAIAIPTKSFFVSVLTRDISLVDAILDLVDNCLDGALRLAGKNDVDYSKHSIGIDLGANVFSIQDDCGGIPREVAKNYAFKMGREPDDMRDSDSETIGMYGVGMKRAKQRDENARDHDFIRNFHVEEIVEKDENQDQAVDQKEQERREFE